jgi:K+-transporting ATPase ATPase B chain
MSGRAVEAAGDVDVLLLDKTGTITLGNRRRWNFMPAPGRSERELGRCGAAGLAGRRNARRAQHRVLAKEEVRLAARNWSLRRTFVPFTAQTRMSGVDLERPPSAKGAPTRS